MTIDDYMSIPRALSDEVYVLNSDVTASYTAGTRVRLIAGIDGNPRPGHHFSRGFVTVCRVDAETAEFVGVKRSILKPQAV